MKTRNFLLILTVCSSLFHTVTPVFGQGTAFTYQGRLNSGTTPANGTYDFTFSLFNVSSGGGALYGPVNTPGVNVSNGLFTVTIDFGGGVFSGTIFWLDIGVRSNGIVSYTALSPRQQLTPTPYAIFAEGANATGITGTLPSGDLSGTYGNAITLNNAGNSFSGNGAGLTGVNALTLGGLGPNNFWKTTGNGGTTAGLNFVGTSDNQPLEFHVNGQRALRVEPDASGFATPNLIGGSANFVSNGVFGATIGGGGGSLGPNSVTNDFGTVAGGVANTSGQQAAIGGGYLNKASGLNAVVGGGYNNNNSGEEATIGGGYGNTVSGYVATVPGGYNNTASGSYSFAAGQNAQALNNGSFVWADNSSSTPFSSTAPNQFLARASFVGINRTTPVTGADAFTVLTPATTGAYGGMYIDTAGTNAWPFYGFAINGAAYAWTYLDGTDGNKWKLYNNGVQLTVATSGNVGIGTTAPIAKLHVAGDTRIEGMTQMGSGTGNAETPDKSLIIRRVKSITTTIGSVVARTDKLTLERNGSNGDWRIVNVAFPGNTTIAATGLSSAGATVNFVTSISSGAAAGTNIVFTDAQSIVSFRCSFGDSFGPNNMTEVSLTRYPGDYYWTGTLTSTYNQ